MTKSLRQKQPESRTPPPDAWDDRLAPPEPEGGANRLILAVTVAGILVAAGLFALAGYATMAPRTPAPAAEVRSPAEPPATGAAAAVPAEPATASLAGAPPAEDGVTVLARRPDEDAGAVPVAAQPAPGAGWAIDLGGAMSFSGLSRRFAEIAALNQEIPFDRLEPRAIIADSATGLEARLLVGPFAGEEDAAAACDSLALPGGVECRPHPFEGELISRE